MSIFKPHIEKGLLVSFHWNSHKNCYSILKMNSKKTIGKLIGYTDSISISDCYFVFHESKRKITLSTQKKDRHSFVVGRFNSYDENFPPSNILYYNPFVSLNFIDALDYFEKSTISPISNCSSIFAKSTTEYGDKTKPHLLYSI